MKPVKVALATSRAISAARLSRRIGALPGYTVCGHAPDLSAAYILAESCEPNLLLIGAELTRQSEFEGLLSLLRVIGIAWKELPEDGSAGTSPLAAAEGETAALSAWLSAVPRPRPGLPALAAMAAPPPSSTGFLPDRLILIGASTGGIDALLTMLAGFPANCPPTAIVQHTGAAFSDSLIRLFRRCTAAEVLPAESGVTLRPGVIMVGAGSPGHLHLAPARPLRSVLSPGSPVSGHIPSIDVLFRSALPFAPSVVAALMTGMGRDGARGLLELRHAGARTFAQDEASSTVWGMPRAAAEIGAASEVLPLQQMAAALLSACQSRTPGLVRQA